MITARQEAKQRGEVSYFSGKDCVHGHSGIRYVRNGNCVECTKARAFDSDAVKAFRPILRARLRQAWGVPSVLSLVSADEISNRRTRELLRVERGSNRSAPNYDA